MADSAQVRARSHIDAQAASPAGMLHETVKSTLDVVAAAVEEALDRKGLGAGAFNDIAKRLENPDCEISMLTDSPKIWKLDFGRQKSLPMCRSASLWRNWPAISHFIPPICR